MGGGVPFSHASHGRARGRDTRSRHADCAHERRRVTYVEGRAAVPLPDEVRSCKKQVTVHERSQPGDAEGDGCSHVGRTLSQAFNDLSS